MKKLKLHLSKLRVESFAASAANDAQGTVLGRTGDECSSDVGAHTCNGPIGMCFPDSGPCGSGMPDC